MCHAAATVRRTVLLTALAVLAVAPPASAWAQAAAPDPGDPGDPATGSSGPGGVLATTPPAAAAPAGAELPGDVRYVSLYGFPGDPSLGLLGRGSPLEAVTRLKRAAAALAQPGVPVKPAFELLVCTAQRTPGSDHRYRKRMDPFTVARWLAVARDAGAELILEVQGGREDFPTEARAFAGVLSQPGVSLGLDPEWRVGPHGVPGRDRGSVSAAEVNATADYLGGLVTQLALPPKLLVVHRFSVPMLRDDARLAAPPGVSLVVDVDGIGAPKAKARTYQALTARTPAAAPGLMLFPRRDDPLLRPPALEALDPPPALVGYQ